MSHTHNRIRPAAVAGLFYPDSPSELKASIQNYLQQAPEPQDTPPLAIIAPHAGYIYSGPIAASAYKQILPVADKIKQVVLLGPSHRVPLRGIATPDADYFETPLGTIKINTQLCQQFESLPFVTPSYEAHQQEHSLEVQLPFLQSILHDFQLIPLVVGECPAEAVAELLETVWNRDDTLVVISTDLSHYNHYEIAQKIDRQTSTAIEQLHPEQIHYDNACGRNPLNGLLTLAIKKNLSINTLDLRNSGDTAGSKDRVVGYGAYAVH